MQTNVLNIVGFLEKLTVWKLKLSFLKCIRNNSLSKAYTSSPSNVSLMYYIKPITVLLSLVDTVLSKVVLTRKNISSIKSYNSVLFLNSLPVSAYLEKKSLSNVLYL